jgi:SAM-dependent methyltransferase
MVDTAEEFYSKHVEDFVDEHSPENWSEELREMLEKFSTEMEGKNVLDAGCGPGFISDFLSRRGANVTGIDVSREMIEYAKENMEGRFLRKDIRELDLEEESFSGVWCGAAVFLLEGEEEIEQVLSDFRQLLKTGGLLYIDFKLGGGKTVKQKWSGEVSEYRISEEEAGDLLEDQGFNILKVEEFENSKGVQYLDYLCRVKDAES